ncbi:folylpolyglutamate synthase [Marchantia polymorpha subsp. ruderalis]|uniref:Folylpolyglutamate synthase n=2 Tax=Marchantia polymorpha TaxID=3197 RepID=A0AAF6BLK3_MARPO|nr:hypothetical protein MARPO_0010s0086 [Marchantia polymorpha]BBN12887.1 hypothetical protein Mp_5g23700 [Marchantia polymorpha subsp. ruderalis]|eukprot:PTQ46687.1 hypothetical protein MARPO_0010s0086 [Marchantia polymorpha]
MGTLSDTSYEAAVEKLNTLIHRNDGDLGPEMRRSWENNFKMTFKHIKILELEEPVKRLSIIHVAGTKGKGSTCAFSESVLRESGFKTGLFTSPHLLDVRERFRFDGLMVSKELFAESFWHVYNRLEEHKDTAPVPGFFRFMLLLALQMFTSQRVDVAILEVGLGGRLDATNAIRAPAVTGISSLGLDHCDLLGNTIDLIAGEKAGIFKPGVPAITAPQPEEAMEVLRKKAADLEIPLEVAPPLETYGLHNLQLGLKGDHQRLNAALAVALCKTWAWRTGNEEHWRSAMVTGGLPESYVRGLEKTRWPGRADIVEDNLDLRDEEPSLEKGSFKFGRLQFFLDGAHSPESMEACGKWFCDEVEVDKKLKKANNKLSNGITNTNGDVIYQRVLLFGCMPRRDPVSLLPPLVNLCSQQGLPVDMAIFAPQSSSYVSITPIKNAPKADFSWQLTLQNHWESLRKSKLEEGNRLSTATGAGSMDLLSSLEEKKGGCQSIGPSSAVMASLPATLEWLRSCARRHPQMHIQVLVTGSLYLVGDMLKLLKH